MEYWECFTMCDSQLRVGMGGAYALDWLTVSLVADSMGILRNELFYKFLSIFENTMLKEINKGNKNG